jgi:predicted amidohydrolase
MPYALRKSGEVYGIINIKRRWYVRMAKYVTISCIGPRPLVIDESVPPQETVERMKQHWQAQLDRVLPDRPDLIVLPEACDRPDVTRYPLEKRLAYYRVRKYQIRDFFADIARRHRCYITYPAHIEAEDGIWRNTMQLLDRDGNVVGEYHKNNLVPDEYLKTNILYGKDAPIFECDFGRVAAAICFDLNFDELRQQYVQAKPDLIVFPSMYHGGLMQGYWAYSCRAYFAGAIAGQPCTIVTPLGEVAAHSTNYYHFITTRVNLDYAVLHIDENGAFFPEIKKKYGPKVHIHDPGFLGCVLLTSEADDLSVEEIIEEYGLERIDEYFSRSEAARHLPGRMESC